MLVQQGQEGLDAGAKDRAEGSGEENTGHGGPRRGSEPDHEGRTSAQQLLLLPQGQEISDAGAIERIDAIEEENVGRGVHQEGQASAQQVVLMQQGQEGLDVALKDQVDGEMGSTEEDESSGEGKGDAGRQGSVGKVAGKGRRRSRKAGGRRRSGSLRGRRESKLLQSTGTEESVQVLHGEEGVREGLGNGEARNVLEGQQDRLPEIARVLMAAARDVSQVAAPT